MKISKILSFILTSFACLSGTALQAAYGDLKWSVTTNDTIFGAPAIGPNGTVYVASEDGNVYAYQANGTLLWIFADSTDWLDSAPTVGPDGNVYVGSWDGNLYAINGTSGQMVWNFTTGGALIGSPAIGPDGTVYIGSNDSFVYAINLDGSQKWISEAVPSYAAIDSSPILSHFSETLYFGNTDGEFFAVSTSTGALLWQFSVSDVHPPDSSTSVSISGSAALDSEGNIYFGCENGYLYSLNPEGELRWSYAASESIRSSPAIDNNETIYFAAQDGYLYAVDSLGFQVSETFVGDVFYCSPAVDANGNVLIAGYAGSSTIGAASRFVSVNPNGQIVWEYVIEDYNDASPNIAEDGTFYFAAHNGKLYAFEGNAPLMADSPWPRFQLNSSQTGSTGNTHPDPTEPSLSDFFSTITQTSTEGWANVPWFGAGWLIARDLPWVEHIELGFIFLDGPTNTSIWFYDVGLNDWLYATSAAPNFYFRAGQGSWIYHLQGTTVYTTRWFFDYVQMDWFSN